MGGFDQLPFPLRGSNVSEFLYVKVRVRGPSTTILTTEKKPPTMASTSRSVREYSKGCEVHIWRHASLSTNVQPHRINLVTQ